jgi:eukaryotic-like serine/threonine-protein kinase
MNDSQWDRAFDLYEATVELAPDRARDKLNSLSDDPEVIHEVMAMLATLNREEPAIERDSAPASKSGLRIGRYEVMELLGCGATGDVYKGRDSELGRPVALKFMTMESTAADSAARRFLREAQAASALNHPNIITVHEVIAYESWPVIVMELVEGRALRESCRQALAPAQVIALGSQILRALAAAHSSGIVHRDLKPENVMVRPDGYVKVLDFGLARQFASPAGSHNLSSNLGLPVGTLRYMSPEQCRGEPATPASDIFAAGLVLYEMSTGQHPFRMDSPLDTAHAIVWTEPAPATKLNSAVPAELNAMILRMLAKDAAMRPGAGEVLRVLAPSDAAPDRRRPRLAIMAAALLVAVGLG